jgi:hypothetical protein
MKARERANVVLHVERLVIAGVPLNTHQAAQVQRAMERELVRLLRHDGAGDTFRSGAVPVVAAPPIHIVSPLRPAELGRHIARSVHHSVTRSA